MRPLNKILSSIGDKAVALIGTVYVLFPLSPLYQQYVYRDSGVFLYMGWRILNGELPYRDVWDHKPPVIFYVNALGLAITPHSRWGVWLLELIGLFLAALIGYKLIQQFFGSFPAILSTFSWLSALVFVIHGGNFTEEYALPLQFLALWLAAVIFKSPVPKYKHWFVMGLIGAIAFFTKQTTIGIWIAIVLFLIGYKIWSRQFRELSFTLLIFSSGLIVVSIGWITLFALQDSLSYFWDCAFEYNLVYSSLRHGIFRHIIPIIAGITPLAQSGLLPLAGIGYFVIVIMLSFNRDHIGELFPLFAIALLDFPLELLLVSISGNTYTHYYITMLPILALLSGITCWVIFASQFLTQTSLKARYILTVGILGIFTWVTFYHQYKTISSQPIRLLPVVSYIQSNTTSKDTVLLWGAESSVNFFSHRKSPSRFVYQYPLYTHGYADERLIVEFLNDLIEKKPKLLIDTHNPQTPLYDFPIQTHTIVHKVAYLRCHYHTVKNIRNWTVYKYTPTANCSP